MLFFVEFGGGLFREVRRFGRTAVRGFSRKADFFEGGFNARNDLSALRCAERRVGAHFFPAPPFGKERRGTFRRSAFCVCYSIFNILHLAFGALGAVWRGLARLARLARLAHAGRACARVCRRGGCGARRFGLVIMWSFLADFSIARNWDYEFY